MYTDYYGLSDRPFQLTPDARFYFDSRTHKKAMAYLGYGLAQGEGFIVITGEVGAGKSTLVAQLMATIDRKRLHAVNLVSTQVEGDDVLRLAAQGVGLATEGAEKAQLLDRFENLLLEEAKAGKRTVLIVDEAQNLSVSALEELRMLSNFQAHGRSLIQIILLGQPEFREKIDHSDRLEQLRQRVIASHHLGAMEQSEVEPYILHRLEVAGWKGRPAFAPDAFGAIFDHTAGIPRRVNQLAGRLLLYGSVEQLDTIDAECVDAVAADMASDGRQPRKDAVLPLRGAGQAPARAANSTASEPARDFALEHRIAALEAQVEEQEAALRRVLTFLVEWVENDRDAPSYRTNAA